MLDHIRPEYLLTLEDYLVHTGDNDGSYGLTLAQIQIYEQVCAESWTVLFFQICKVFVVGRLPAKPYKPLFEAF